MRFVPFLTLSLCMSWAQAEIPASLSSLEKIRVVYFSYPPHMIITKKGLTGATHDVWERIGKRAKVKVEWVGPVPFLRAQAMLENGDVDAIMRIVKLPEREKKFIYAKKPNMWGAQGLAVLKTDPLEHLQSPEDLNGKVIGMLSGGSLPPYFADNKSKFSIEPVSADTVPINMKKLFKGRIWGVYFVFTDIAKYYAAKENRLHEIKFVSYPGSQGLKHAHLAFSRKASPPLIEKVEKAAQEEVKHYDYEELSAKYVDLAAKGKIDEVE